MQHEGQSMVDEDRHFQRLVRLIAERKKQSKTTAWCNQHGMHISISYDVPVGASNILDINQATATNVICCATPAVAVRITIELLTKQ